MASKITIFLFMVFLPLKFQSSKAQAWIRAGYWYSGSEFPISDINSELFSHLICAFAEVNSTSYELSISSSNEQMFSTFADTVKQKNPSVTALLSIGGVIAHYLVFSEMVSNLSHRKSFIDSSIRLARLNGFQGLDLCWVSANTSSDMTNMGILFKEWRNAASSEANNSGKAELILTAAVRYLPDVEDASFPVDSIRSYLDWIHVMAYDYHMPQWYNFTGAQAAPFNPSSETNSDFGISSWIGRGISSSKLVLALPYYGYAWTLVNPKENGIGAPARGPAISEDGSMAYKDIKGYIERYNAQVIYNATYVLNYCSVGSTWIGFDDVEAVKVKVSYAKEKKLLGYVAWHVANDDNWVLSLAGALIYYSHEKKLRSKANASKFPENYAAAAGDFNNNAPNLRVFSLADNEAATKGFSVENKLGEGGYGPVYKGVLPNGQEIAVKKLSTASTQGFEEFKNEVVLTAKLQHVNLVRVLGFCIERDEQMLIYEYMPNKSLDLYLFDPIRRYSLDWRKRVDIIEGLIQGLLYLQEYSRLTIIHRDLKASNILLDYEMKPKISDFGMARIFAKDRLEANTSRIVGTYGYLPPEYAKRGLYSTKSDVYCKNPEFSRVIWAFYQFSG
ncbi:Phosphorylase kinase, gamma catalytic subunit [Parasponia andersonii]|uniref:Phosphorylase kinase, gamma catalytic subunit n=1 Tax=Parasponia andersonii TaxID=3476 RepID=A0A2P5AF58_PARAD|nr:Phosphorylase kinase, gamma catalytic subunit [Parasponia andersonii]